MRKLMFGVQSYHQPGGGTGIAGGDPTATVPSIPAGAPPPQHPMAGMTEEQYGWAMKSMNQQHQKHNPAAAHTMHQAMGGMHYQAMGGGFNTTMMGASTTNGVGGIMGATTYNPALLQAMMAGMGSFPPNDGAVMAPTYPQNLVAQRAAVEGVVGEGGGGDFGTQVGEIGTGGGGGVPATGI
jgi:hypothetical protein